MARRSLIRPEVLLESSGIVADLRQDRTLRQVLDVRRILEASADEMDASATVEAGLESWLERALA